MPTYPNETYPGDAVIQALDGTTDVKTGLAYIAKGTSPNSTPSYEIQYNRRLQRQNTLLGALRAGMVAEEGSLKVGVYPVDYTLLGVRKSFGGATNQSVPDNVTRKVYLDENNTLQIQAAFPASLQKFLPLATVVTSNGLMTVTDERPSVLYAVGPVDPAAKAFPMAPSVFLGGTLSVGVAVQEWAAPLAFTLRSATGRVRVAPAGAALIVDLRINGASIFASQSEMVNIAAGSQQDVSAVKNAAVAAGDVLTLEIEQVGSTTAGSDLTVSLHGLATMDASV